MRQPSIPTLIFGNTLVMVGLFLAFLWVGYQWLTGAGSGLATLIAAAVVASSGRANSQVRAWQLWRMEWNAMSGEATRVRSNAARHLAAGLGWLMLAWCAIAYAHDPSMALAVTLFWMTTAAMVGGGAYRLTRHGKTASRRRQVTVTMCLDKPTHSPGLQQAYQALPSHCLQLSSG